MLSFIRAIPRQSLAVLVAIPFLFFTALIIQSDLRGYLNYNYETSGGGNGLVADSSNPIWMANNNNNNTKNNNMSNSNSQSSSSSSSLSSSSCYCDTIPFIPGEPVYDSERIIIFLITPTYTRPTQMADMTRLAQTLRLVPDVFWIVVEDAHNKSLIVEDLLVRTNIPYAHLLGPRPPTHLDKRSGRGVSNRLKAFKWLRDKYAGTEQKGVIYMADDDNAYDIRIFDEMRDTKIVSMFPVGLISTLGLSTPIVSQKTGKIIGFHDPFIGRRRFAVDMAGFAVNLQYFLSKDHATMPYKVGYEEDYFLRSLDIRASDLEPKAQNCTQIYVWHTKTKPADNPKLNLMKKVDNYNETNLPTLYENVLQFH